MINLKILDEDFEEYKRNKILYEKYKQESQLMYEENKEELDNLLNKYLKLKRKMTRCSPYEDEYFVQRKKWLKFRNDNQLLDKYLELKNKRDGFFEKLDSIINYSSAIEHVVERIVILLHKDKKILMNLYSREEIDLSNFGKEKIDFVIEMLKNRHSFIGYIIRDDLPLMMNILEDLDGTVSYNDMDSCDIAEENYLNKVSKCYNIYLEFKRAHMFDNNEEKNGKIVNKITIPFDINEDIAELIKNKYTMDKETYLEKYYTLLILRDRNIEEMFLNIPEDHKKYLINAYYKLSTYKEHKTLEENRMHLRTASPVINCEVLKLLYKKKK